MRMFKLFLLEKVGSREKRRQRGVDEGKLALRDGAPGAKRQSPFAVKDSAARRSEQRAVNLLHYGEPPRDLSTASALTEPSRFNKLISQPGQPLHYFTTWLNRYRYPFLNRTSKRETAAVHSEIRRDQNLDQFGEILPNHSLEDVHRIISKRHGNVEDTVNWLAAFEHERHEMRARIEDLPQELKDMISGHVLTVPATPKKEAVSKITPDYKPPITLQVDRDSRSTFAQAYYAGRILEVMGTELCRDWLRSLPREHRDMIKVIRCNRWNSGTERADTSSGIYSNRRPDAYEARKKEIRGTMKATVFR
ncbi:hypothetical protein DOTSEDRAFT_37642 [Dothistroma septosporum NZE10]|uniref:Uncharacterized protein n=1 Tax=Dothistroma septosporum (strain NZE10 / CBS 128990) TaxID=675120 RepID=N1PFM3_DOTSN|nr:hypothetical protein DOTSEDRAFT_37642 [Dothistroma septosporum NZE10]